MYPRTYAIAIAVLSVASVSARTASSGTTLTAPEPISTYTLKLERSSAGTYTATLNSFNGPYRYAGVVVLPQGCSAGTVLTPQPAAATLRDISVSPSLRRAELRVPAATSGNCALVGQFDLRAEDRPPSHNEPDPVGPGQGQIMMRVVVGPPTDLVAADPVQLGPHTHTWDSSADLLATDASARGNGICTFQYTYSTLNTGAGVSVYTGNTLSLDNANGPELASDPLPGLAPAGTSLAKGSIGLPPGKSVLVLNVDALQWVEETSETDNVRSIEVNVLGNCN